GPIARTHVLFGLGAEEDSSGQVSVLILGSVAEAEFARRRVQNSGASEERQLRTVTKRPALPSPALPAGQEDVTSSIPARLGSSPYGSRRPARSFEEQANAEDQEIDERRSPEPRGKDAPSEHEWDSAPSTARLPKVPAPLRPPELQHPPLETPPPPSLEDDRVERAVEKSPHQTSVGAGLTALVKKISQGVKKTGLVPGISHAEEEYIKREATRVVRPQSDVKPAPRDERPTAPKPKQEMFQFEQTTRGRFEKSQPTIVDGEDLDIPTFMRQKPK
ncbi:MAG: hypothetical protein SNJ52_03730, partial [Verrucomicrobiia bacterium]